MQHDRFGHAVHGEIAGDIAALRSRPRHVATFECEFGKLLDVEKFRAAQMIVALLDSGVDAGDVNFRRDRRIFRMLPVDVDFAAEFAKLAVGCSEILMSGESDGRARLIEFVLFICCDGAGRRDRSNKNQKAFGWQ